MKNYFIAWECGSSDPFELLDVLALQGPFSWEEANQRLDGIHAQKIKASIIQVNSKINQSIKY